VRVAGDFVAVVLEETFTPAEKTLIARGGSEGIQFRSIVLRNDLTSRPVAWSKPARSPKRGKRSERAPNPVDVDPGDRLPSQCGPPPCAHGSALHFFLYASA
jgi:hypothetical protein